MSFPLKRTGIDIIIPFSCWNVGMRFFFVKWNPTLLWEGRGWICHWYFMQFAQGQWSKMRRNTARLLFLFTSRKLPVNLYWCQKILEKAQMEYVMFCLSVAHCSFCHVFFLQEVNISKCYYKFMCRQSVLLLSRTRPFLPHRDKGSALVFTAVYISHDRGWRWPRFSWNCC